MIFRSLISRLNRPIAMLIVLFLPVIVYPTLLIHAQFPWNFSLLSLHHYVAPLPPPRFALQYELLSVAFVFAFVYVYAISFAQTQRNAFALLAAIITIPLYFVISWGFTAIFDRNQDLARCTTSFMICVPPIVHGYLCSISISIGAITSARLLSLISNERIFHAPPQQTLKSITLVIWVLFSIVAYPIFVFLLGNSKWLDGIGRALYFDPAPAGPSPLGVLLLVTFTAYCTAVLWPAFLRSWDITRYILVNILSFALYVPLIAIGMAVYSASIENAAACAARGFLLCLPFLDQSILLHLSVVLAILAWIRIFPQTRQ
jgi:hypothetical protein